MQKKQSKQIILYLYRRHSQNFLKVCYFFICLLLLSCVGDTSKKEKKEQIETTETEITPAVNSTTKTILFFGDSLTAGYGLDDIKDAYPAIIQAMIDSLGLEYTVINSGLSGETSAGGRSRIKWVLNQKIDVFVLELGANDGLRGIPLKETRENLQAIIDAVHEKEPGTPIILAGMQLPPNMGPEYITEFSAIFPKLAEKNKIELIPFLLKDVGGIAKLNQGDGIHPTIEGQRIVANNVWPVLEKVIQ